ncbi:TonB-dependent receptor, partial [Mitsuaria sp. GD03876]|uniref:TonB-dependent receptor n=1 Tax=Mitsuaria sp. GD03876 TaxID=2975399 RepID=UPI00244B0AF4
TSSKRRQKQAEVAGTVSVVSGADLESRGARDQEDVFKLTPGVQANKGDPNQAVPTIRGIGTASNGTLLGIQQATTGFYIEEVPFTDPFGFVSGADLSPFDLKQIEVLRGPQGALFGSASLGGAVSYLLNRPDLKRTEFAAVGSVERLADGGTGHAVSTMLNMPIQKDVAALRVVAFDRRDPGYLTNLGTGKTEANELHQHGGRILASLRPTSSLLLTGMALTQRTVAEDTFAVSPDPSRRTTDAKGAAPRSSQFDLGTLRVEWTLPNGLELTSNTAYLDKQGEAVADATRAYSKLGSYFGPALGVGALPDLPSVRSRSPETRRSRATSQELRLATTGDTGLQGLVGVFYQRTRFSDHAVNVAPGGAALWGPLGPALLPDDVLASVDVAARTTERAVFAEGEYHFNPAWSATIGGRYYRTALDYDARTLFMGSPSDAATGLSESGFTPKVSLKYRFGPHMAYLLASKGYRFGGVNANPPVLSRYKSDSLWNYEAGVRLVPARGLNLSLTAFLLDWKDAQVSATLPGTIPLVGVANVGQAKSVGVESALTWQVTRQLDLSATAAYIDAHTTETYVNGGGATVPSGARLPGTARFQSTLQGSYAFDGPADTAGRFSVAHSFTGRRVFEIEGTTTAPGFSQTDLRLALSRGPWELTLSVNNLFDKHGVNGAATFSLPGVTSYTDYYLIRPRGVGLSLRYDL